MTLRLWWLVALGGAALPNRTWAAQDSTARATVIAVSPVELPPALQRHSLAIARFDELIAARVREAGYATVPAETTLVVWVRTRDSLGGFYDAYTGKVVPAKRAAIFEAMRRALRDRYGADAWLQPSIRLTGAAFEGGKVRWDGAEEGTGGRGGLLGLLLLGTDVGTIPATSLRAYVESMDGRPMYDRAGGIRVLNQWLDGSWVIVPDPFEDAVRNGAAVRTALDSLVAALVPRRSR